MVSCFTNVFETKNPTHCPLMDILELMKESSDIKTRITSVRSATSPEEMDRQKIKLLPIFTPAGTFSSRNDDALITYSGVVCLDLDDTLDPKSIITLAKTYPYTLATMTSPTGTGIKVFVLTDSTDPSRHSDLYHHLGDIMGFKKRMELKFDPSCCNPSRACFFSYDKGLWINHDVQAYHVDFDTIPVYSAPAKTTATVPARTTDIAFDDVSFPVAISEYATIREAIKKSHTFFEEYYPMHEGTRNSNLYILAFFFRLDGIPKDAATDHLTAYHSDPSGGFTAEEIRRTVHSAYSK